MTTFCIEPKKSDLLNKVLEEVSLELYKLDDVVSFYIIPYIIWKKYDERELGEEGINIVCYIVLKDLEHTNQKLENIIERLNNLREKTSVNVIGVKKDVNSYGENNQYSYSRRINDNSVYNGEIIFDKTGYIFHVKNMTLFSSGVVEYENKIEFKPPLQIEKIRNLIAK